VPPTSFHASRQSHGEDDQQGDDPLPPRVGQRQREQQRQQADADHRHHRRRVDEHVERQRGGGLSRRQSMPDEKDLRRFAGDETERRDVAERVAGEIGGPGLSQRDACAWRHATTPRFRADHEAKTRQPEDRHEAPANATNAGGDLVPADVADRHGKQHRAGKGGRRAGDIALANGHGSGINSDFVWIRSAGRSPR
jgi:hypothetical protein